MTLPSAGPSGRANVDPPVALRTRAPRRGRLPTLSVVVASKSDRHALQACLTSLLEQCERMRAEVVVARASSSAELSVLSKLYPGVSFVPAAPDTPFPELRALGFSHAAGDVVAIMEDHCAVDAHWLESIIRHAADATDSTPGSADEPRSSTIAEWAPYLGAYGIHVPVHPADPGGDGEPAAPPSTLADERPGDGAASRVIEWARHACRIPLPADGTQARASVLRFAETVTTSATQPRTVAEFCADRFVQGRDYASERLATQPARRRWLLLSLSPLMPVALTWRAATLVGGEQRRAFMRALPVALVLFASWALGEAVGYARGRTRVASAS